MTAGEDFACLEKDGCDGGLGPRPACGKAEPRPFGFYSGRGNRYRAATGTGPGQNRAYFRESFYPDVAPGRAFSSGKLPRSYAEGFLMYKSRRTPALYIRTV